MKPKGKTCRWTFTIGIFYTTCGASFPHTILPHYILDEAWAVKFCPNCGRKIRYAK